MKEKLEEYYGLQNEIKEGLVPETLPVKPDELVVYELIKSTGLHLVPGGLMQQPHIWMMQWELIDGTVKLWKHLDKLAEEDRDKK